MSKFERLPGGLDTEVGAFGIDQPNAPGLDPTIDQSVLPRSLGQFLGGIVSQLTLLRFACLMIPVARIAPTAGMQPISIQKKGLADPLPLRQGNARLSQIALGTLDDDGNQLDETVEVADIGGLLRDA